MTGTILFIVGLVGTVVFVIFRLWEATRPQRFFDTARGALDRGAEMLYQTFVFGEVPRQYRARLAVLARIVSHRAIHGAVLALRAIERPLSRISHRIRISAPSTEQEPSEFLKTITPQKEDGKKSQDSV